MHGEAAYQDNHLTEAAKTWASGMSGLTGEQVADGLRECVDCGEAWPPGLPEFVAMCRGKAKNGFGLDYVPECYRDKPEIKALPILKSDPKTVKDWIEKMKKANRGTR